MLDVGVRVISYPRGKGRYEGFTRLYGTQEVGCEVNATCGKKIQPSTRQFKAEMETDVSLTSLEHKRALRGRKLASGLYQLCVGLIVIMTTTITYRHAFLLGVTRLRDRPGNTHVNVTDVIDSDISCPGSGLSANEPEKQTVSRGTLFSNRAMTNLQTHPKTTETLGTALVQPPFS